MPFPAKLLRAATLFGGLIGMVRLAAAAAAGKEMSACGFQAQPSVPGTCSRYLGMLERCNSIVNDKKALVACFCSQDILDGAFYCKQEVRECVLSHDLDSEVDEDIMTWHSVCDKTITFSPTTPTFAPLSATFRPEDCSAAAEACVRRDHGVRLCRSAYADATEAQSCLCQPAQVSLALRCRGGCDPYRTFNSSDVPEVKYCGAGQVTMPASNSSGTTRVPPPMKTTEPPVWTSFGPVATSTTLTTSAASSRPSVFFDTGPGRWVGLVPVVIALQTGMYIFATA